MNYSLKRKDFHEPVKFGDITPLKKERSTCYKTTVSKVLEKVNYE